MKGRNKYLLDKSRSNPIVQTHYPRPLVPLLSRLIFNGLPLPSVTSSPKYLRVFAKASYSPPQFLLCIVIPYLPSHHRPASTLSFFSSAFFMPYCLLIPPLHSHSYLHLHHCTLSRDFFIPQLLSIPFSYLHQFSSFLFTFLVNPV